MPLDDGNWFYAREFERIDAIHTWGWQTWHGASIEDRGIMLAHYRESKKMAAWEAQQAERAAKRSAVRMT